MGSRATKSTGESPTEYYSSTYESYSNIEETNERIPDTPYLIPEASHQEIRELYMDSKSSTEQISSSILEELSVAALKLADLSIESLETDRPALQTPLKYHTLLDVEPRSSNVEMQCWNPVIVRASPDKEFPAIIRDKNFKKVKNVVEGATKSTDQYRTRFGLINRKEVKNSNMDRLKVSDNPRKKVKVGSKIPVFKGKKAKVQCENIQPRNMMPNTGSSKKTQWDPKN